MITFQSCLFAAISGAHKWLLVCVSCFLLSGLGSHFDKCQLRDCQRLQRSQSAVPLPNPLMSSRAPMFGREAVTNSIPLADGTKSQIPGIMCIHADMKQLYVVDLVWILSFDKQTSWIQIQQNYAMWHAFLTHARKSYMLYGLYFSVWL